MAIDYEKLMAWRFEEVRQVYSKRDTILYALGLGLGADPLDETALRFVYERNLAVLPTFPAAMAGPKTWWRETGQVDYNKVVHGEQSLRIHRLPSPEGEVIGSARITGIVDKGAGRGALLFTERTITDAASGERLATVGSTSFARADGGFGGPSGPLKPVHELPSRAPDARVEFVTLPQAALIYRLSGDYNLIHVDPEIARQAGFERPILQGLNSYGVAGWAVLQAACGGDPARLLQIDARFSASVYPGEKLLTELWIDGAIVSFRTSVPARNIVALNNGYAEIRPA